MKTLADRINARMKIIGMTQEQLAQAIGISQASVNKITSGKTKKPREIVAIAKSLRTTIDYLVDGKEDLKQVIPDAYIGLTETQKIMLLKMQSLTQSQQEELLKTADTVAAQNEEIMAELLERNQKRA